jgi:hypothetical protein
MFKARMAVYPDREAAAVGFQAFIAGLQAEPRPLDGQA